MRDRRGLWPILLTFAVWQVLRPLMYGLLEPTGVTYWVPWSVCLAGDMGLVAWFAFWLYGRSAPARELLAQGRREHPGAEVWVVELDAEWNPIPEPAMTTLVADRGRLLINGFLEVPGNDVVSVATVLVTVRWHALSIVVGDATWTVLVRGGRWGTTGDRVITQEAAQRIGAALQS